MRPTFRPLLIGALACAAVSAPLLAQGRMTRTEPPPPPAVDANQCVIHGHVYGGMTPARIRKNRAENEAKDQWRKKVRALYGPEFAKWDNASSQQGKEVTCEKVGFSGSSCSARAVPCRGR